MASNIEMKARVEDPVALRQRALALNPNDVYVLEQVDTFFHCQTGRLKLRQFADGSAELIAYQRPNTQGARESVYYRTPTADGAGLLQALTASLGIKTIVRKRREVMLVGQSRIHLDAVESLGDFMEIEVVLEPDQSASDGETILADLMQKLAIASEHCIAGAYADFIE
ncbi:MAG: class IV adenylate cyclase [Planctomycetota bacterium]|nr:class IV adenylate cyclase [Planctomycetota bacterium]